MHPLLDFTLSIALMDVEIKLVNFAIKSRFKDENCKRMNHTKVQDACENYAETDSTFELRKKDIDHRS